MHPGQLTSPTQTEPDTLTFIPADLVEVTLDGAVGANLNKKLAWMFEHKHVAERWLRPIIVYAINEMGEESELKHLNVCRLWFEW